jgi:hypothetical protein
MQVIQGLTIKKKLGELRPGDIFTFDGTGENGVFILLSDEALRACGFNIIEPHKLANMKQDRMMWQMDDPQWRQAEPTKTVHLHPNAKIVLHGKEL